jgi:predicted alpha/beta hydrolase family esterase
MRTSDSDILFVPGLGGSGPDHWQTRWETKLSTARRIDQDDWEHPDPDTWPARIAEAVESATRPIVLVAHSLGVIALVKAAPRFPEGRVRGALLVAPADVEEAGLKPAMLAAFAPIPREPLAFPSLLVGSRTDPYCTYERAEDLAYAWGSVVVDAGEAGHLNPESGFGPWPEGLMRFAGFLQQL